jgi:PQQ-dependent catabolism-associated CXXCW motif protein
MAALLLAAAQGPAGAQAPPGGSTGERGSPETPAAREILALDPPPEPEGYRLESYRTPTPATLRGATVLGTEAARALWEAKAAAFIDVMPQAPRPPNLPPDTVWRQAPRESLPGALWLPNTGYGRLAPETEAYFRRGLAAASAGDPSRPLVFFCMRDCWMSWNAAKLALSYGTPQVYWFPDGTDGWREAGLPLERVEPAP